MITGGPTDLPPPPRDEDLGKVIPLRAQYEHLVPSARGSSNGNGNGGHAPGPPPTQPPTPFDNDGPPAQLRSRSYATAVRVVDENLRDVLEGRALEWNEMSGVATLARKPLTDVDLARIRWLCERRLPGGVDKNGNQKPLVLDRTDILDAVLQVADMRKYHPVRSYLTSLKWDGVRRLEQLPRLMTVDDTPLARTLLRCWFVSAVARVSDPGCQVDTMLVLVGPQGARKSSFFRMLAGAEFFLDTPIDIHSKDAYITLRRAFIAEWPELESLNRARDAEAVKAFLTSAVDTYRPPFGRMDVRSPRSCVIVGTTNHKQFLVDETGGRRFWPLLVRLAIDLTTITAWRDQLWAEAFEAYTAGERWYLDLEMEQALVEHQADFKVSDAWESMVLGWTEPRAVPFGIAEVLKDALSKPAGQWTRADEMRVSRILVANGYTSARLHRGGRVWSRRPVTTEASFVEREPGSDDV